MTTKTKQKRHIHDRTELYPWMFWCRICGALTLNGGTAKNARWDWKLPKDWRQR